MNMQRMSPSVKGSDINTCSVSHLDGGYSMVIVCNFPITSW